MALNSNKRAYTAFVCFRILGVVLRPLTLLAALNLPESDFARDYALLLTAIASSYVIYGNQNHRLIYVIFVGAKSKRRGLGGTKLVLEYIDGIAVHLLLFAPVVGVVVWLWLDAFWLWLLVIPLVFVEKYYDDQQRVLIYQRRYLMWCRHFVFRTIIPSGLLLATVILWGWGSLPLYTFTCLAMWLIYFIYISPHFTRVLKKWFKLKVKYGLGPFASIFPRYLRAYMREYLGAQLIAIFAINLMLLDRFFVNQDFTEQFASYVFAVNVFAAITLAHNMFHFTRIRPLLIDETYPVVRAVFSLPNLVMPMCLALGTISGLVLINRIQIVDVALPLAVLVSLAGVYTIAAVSLVLQELAFWRVKRYWIVGLDACIFGIAFLAFNSGLLSLAEIPLCLAILLSVRAFGIAMLSASHSALIRLPQTEGPDAT